MSENYSANPNSFVRGADQPHTTRYLAARGIVKPGDVVVDCACGFGYGSKLLAQVAETVISIDKNPLFQDAPDNVITALADLDLVVDLPNCDVIVSIETIEHLKDPQRFLDLCVATGASRIVISSPNIDTAGGENEFHISNVKVSDLERMMAKYPDYFFYGCLNMGISYIAYFVHKDYKFI